MIGLGRLTEIFNSIYAIQIFKLSLGRFIHLALQIQTVYLIDQ